MSMSGHFTFSTQSLSGVSTNDTGGARNDRHFLPRAAPSIERRCYRLADLSKINVLAFGLGISWAENRLLSFKDPVGFTRNRIK